MLRHHTAGMVWVQNHTCPGHLAMVPHTHTQTHTHSLTHTHTCTLRAHTCTHTLVGGHSLTLTEDKKYSLTYVHMHIHTHVPHIHMYHTYPHTCTHTHTCTSTHTCTHTHTSHVYTQVPLWCIQICRFQCDVYTMPRSHCDIHKNTHTRHKIWKSFSEIISNTMRSVSVYNKMYMYVVVQYQHHTDTHRWIHHIYG